MSSRSQQNANRAAAAFRQAAVSVGKTDTALGACYRRMSAKLGRGQGFALTISLPFTGRVVERSETGWGTAASAVLPHPGRFATVPPREGEGNG